MEQQRGRIEWPGFLVLPAYTCFEMVRCITERVNWRRVRIADLVQYGEPKVRRRFLFFE